ncbi:PqqD family protein [Microbacterium sp. AK031]|uniref:PqqD family protein n=1 Tax=Microbacterium sp. AK031 TaxID=2723076 RepID=UPI002168EFFF|nr:PqqD family protein [Microbacterium sp. AK031]MCS3841754.1 hypothetical protein [Microbacterium sp. AK031]
MGERQTAERISIAADAAWVQTGTRVVVIDLVHLAQDPIVLEGTAAIIWETIALSDGTSLTEIISDLAEDFALDEDRIRADVEEMVRTLTARGALSVR